MPLAKQLNCILALLKIIKKKFMKKITLLVALSLCSVLSIFAQGTLNMNLLANVDFPENCNDVWGYVAPDGTEYGIVGTVQATVVFSLADPTNPEQVFRVEGANSTWRDMKTWGDFIYVTTDVGQDGLLIIDMSDAPNNITSRYWMPDFTIDGSTSTLQTCHNLYIDEKGYIYLAGCNMNGGGLIILDAFTTPGQPVYIGAGDARYSHDVMVADDVAYSSDINAGFFSVIDVSDKTNPETLVTQNTTMNFTHNAWRSDDGNYLFTTDERGNAYVDAYDISDLTDIKLLDFHQPAENSGSGVIPHNTHYYDGYLVTSWYTDGVRITDASRPDNLIEVGYYETWQGAPGGFNGCWGAYPYLPSGNVLAVDIQSGFFVLGAEYQRACFLEGTVTDAENGNFLNDVKVEIVAGQINSKLTNNTGEYKSGLAEAGDYAVTFSKPGYENATGIANLVNGQVTILDMELNPLPRFAFSGSTVRDADGNGISNGSVYLVNEQFEFSTFSGTDGTFLIEDVWSGTYDVYGGAWGYRNIYFGEVTIEEAKTIEIRLDEAFMDDFIVDLGWTVEGDATTGMWTRGEPVGTGFGNNILNPDEDIPNDVGDFCYVTGNGGGDAGTDDVDDGSTILTSPMMDLTTMENPTMNYNLWFVNGGGQGAPDDMLTVRVTNGKDEITLETLDANSPASEWITRSEFNLTGMIEITSTMQLIVETGDLGNGHLVEAGIDAFEVTDGQGPSSSVEIDPSISLNAFPNPFTDQVTLEFKALDNVNLILTNIVGQEVLRMDVSNKSSVTFRNELPTGIYFATIGNETKVSAPLKLIAN